MAITKILARKGRLDVGINYVLNGDKTEGQILTARLNCEPNREYQEMLNTKQNLGKTGGVQYYHISRLQFTMVDGVVSRFLRHLSTALRNSVNNGCGSWTQNGITRSLQKA